MTKGPIAKQDHLRMNVSPDLNNHLRSIDLFRSMINDGILSLVSSSLGFMKIEDDLIDVVLDQYMLPKV